MRSPGGRRGRPAHRDRERRAGRAAGEDAGRSSERGMVTVELAIGVVAATLVAAFLAGLTLLGVAQAACAETASQVARQTARGDVVAVREAEERAPAGAVVEVSRDGRGVSARVTAPFRLLSLAAAELTVEAWAAYEPGVGP